MMIFADTLSLLLAFFVLLFSMSTLRVDTWLSMANGLADRLNPARYESPNPGPSERNLPRSKEQSAMNLGYLAPLFEEKLRSTTDLADLTLTTRPDRLVVSIPCDILFPKNGAALSRDGTRRIFVLGGLLGTIDNRVVVASYADSSGPDGQQTGAMVLSIERAVSVARALGDSGYNGVASAMGYADPAGQSFTIEPTRRDRDRVDIVIYDSQGDASAVKGRS
jgi:chemotaxis protein MotB